MVIPQYFMKTSHFRASMVHKDTMTSPYRLLIFTCPIKNALAVKMAKKKKT
jgi:hypothetical protein